jgi:hypothetical protein
MDSISRLALSLPKILAGLVLLRTLLSLASAASQAALWGDVPALKDLDGALKQY